MVLELIMNTNVSCISIITFKIVAFALLIAWTASPASDGMECCSKQFEHWNFYVAFQWFLSIV